ncbi:MAG: FkbM family methyltransferase [Candidatus Thorarchaeota archaeon]
MRAVELLRKYGLRIIVRTLLWKMGFMRKHNFKYPIYDFDLEVTSGSFLYWHRLAMRDEFVEHFIDMIRFFRDFDLIKQKNTIFDVGAWVGPASFLFSYLVGDEGEVHSFEPAPEVYSGLVANLELNSMNNVSAYKLAVSDSNTDNLQFYRKDKETAGATINPEVYANHPQTFSARSVTIDKFVEQHGLAPDGLKIDVEGAELRVLRGAKKVIAKLKPWLLIEFHGPYMTKQEATECWDIIKKNSRKIVYICGEDPNYRYGDEMNNLDPPVGRTTFCVWY